MGLFFERIWLSMLVVNYLNFSYILIVYTHTHHPSYKIIQTELFIRHITLHTEKYSVESVKSLFRYGKTNFLVNQTICSPIFKQGFSIDSSECFLGIVVLKHSSLRSAVKI